MTEQTRPPTAQPAAAPAPTARPRLYYLDNLRIVLTVLVVLHHVGVTYGNIPVWFYTEPAKDPTGQLLDLFVLSNQMYFMGIFFLISGFFTPGSLDRKGGRAFMRGRLVRLGIPLLVFLVLLRPMVNFSTLGPLREAFAADGHELPYWLFYLLTWDPGPMWFVEVLLVFALVYTLVRRFRGRRAVADTGADGAAAPATARTGLAAWTPGFPAVVGYVAALVVVTFTWRLLVPVGAYWPVVGLPTPSYLPQYASMFAIGVLAFRYDWFSALTSRAGWLGLAAAVLGFAGAVFSYVVLKSGLAYSVGSVIGESVFAVGTVIALLVLFRARFNHQGRFACFLSDQAFTVYIVHPLVLVGVASAFSSLDALAVVKFVLVGAVSLPLCWALAYLVRSLPYAKRVL